MSDNTYYYRVQAENVGGSSAYSNTASASPLQDGFPSPIASWPFNFSNQDVSGYGRDIVIYSPQYSDTDLKEGSSSLQLDGIDTWCELVSGGSGFLHDKFTQRTVSLWIKNYESNGIQEIFEEGGTTHGIALRLNNGVLEGAVRNGRNQKNISFSYPPDSLWHNVSIIFDNGLLTLLLDGVVKDSLQTGFSNIPNHGDGAGLGNRYNGDAFGISGDAFFQGWIDDVRIFEDALSQEELATIMDEGKVPDVLEYTALSDLYNQCNGSQWKYKDSWLTGRYSEDIDKWYGVRIQHKDVVELKLNFNNIKGDLPASIEHLLQLSSLNLNNDSIISIPSSIGKLKNLKQFYVFNNQLSSLPIQIGDLANLEELHLGSNQIFNIPTTISNLSSLEFFDLSNNRLNTLPELSISMKELYFNNSSFTELPATIFSLVNLEKMTFAGNMISDIPSGIGNLSKLISLDASYNAIMTLPSSIKNLQLLSSLNLSHNLLADLPGELYDLSNLQILNISSN